MAGSSATAIQDLNGQRLGLLPRGSLTGFYLPLYNLHGIRLEQSMPNPAVANTTIRFDLGQARDVSLVVRDAMGRTVRQDDMGTLSAGNHSVDLNVSGWSSGVYTYTLIADGLRSTKKMTVK